MALSETVIKEIERSSRSMMGRQHMPGLAVGVVRHNELIYKGEFGQARIVEDVPVQADTVFRIASISKVLTAIGVMKLAHQGAFSIEDPINQHLKGFQIRPRAADDPPATIRHVLSHTSGLGELTPLINYLHPGSFFGMALPGRPLLPLAKFYIRPPKSDSPPGAKWAYANPGYAVLGQLIADVAGKSFPEAMREMIFDPLNMKRSDFVRRPDLVPHMAFGYGKPDSLPSRISGRRRQAFDLDILTMADGSLMTTINDFSRFVSALLNNGDKIIPVDAYHQMLTPQFQTDPRLAAMGLGFFLENRDDWNGHLVAQHDGSWLGFTSSLFFAPDSGWGVYAFTNTNASGVITLARGILRTLLNAPYKGFQPIADQPQLWPELIGTYRPQPGFNSNFRVWTGYGGLLKVYEEEGKLKVKGRRGGWQKGVTLRAIDNEDSMAFSAGGWPLYFKRGASGKIDRLVLKFREFFKQ